MSFSFGADLKLVCIPAFDRAFFIWCDMPGMYGRDTNICSSCSSSSVAPRGAYLKGRASNRALVSFSVGRLGRESLFLCFEFFPLGGE